MNHRRNNSDVPLLETSRLVLRELRQDDFDNFARICADPEAMRFLGTGRPLSRYEAWRSFAFFIGYWRLRGFGMWAVADKTSHRMIGRLGFHQPEGWAGFEIGWLIDRECWGQGFATVAARSVLPLAASMYGQSHVISLIHPENAASIPVAEKISESLEGDTELNGTRVLIFGITLR